MTPQELIDLPENTPVRVLDAYESFEAGDTIYRYYNHNDDELSCFFSARPKGSGKREYMTCDEVELIVEPTISIHALEPVHTGQVEIGNPKVGAASKKFSLRYLPLSANIEANRALENGADKYGLCNWRDTNVKASVYIDAALRHIFQWQEGQEDASDSTVHNLGHAMASLAIIIDAQAQGVLIDDRPTASKDTDALLLRSA